MNKTSNSKLIDRKHKRLIEAEAFFNGTQNIPIENSLEVITAEFAGLGETIQDESSEIIKKLDAEREIASQRRTESEIRWQMWREMTDGIVPPFANPFGKVAAAFAAMTGEAVLLAPLMDLFGVAEYEFQFILASVIVIILALLCELPIHLWREKFNRWTVYAVGTAIASGMIALGVFRAFGLQAIEAKKSPLISSFLDENFVLSAIVIVFLTAALPIGAAFAFDLGWQGLSRRRQWQKARKDAFKFAKLHETYNKKLEAELERREKRLAELGARREAWTAAERQAHEEGKRLKARRKPFWEIAFLLVGGCLLIGVSVITFAYIFCDEYLLESITSDDGRFTIYAIVAVGLMSLFTYRVVKRWNSPNPAQLYADRTAVFYGETENSPKIIERRSEDNLIAPKLPETATQNGNFAEIR